MKRLSDHPHLNTVVRLTFRNRASQIYLGLVVAAALFVAVDTLFVTHEDASFGCLAVPPRRPGRRPVLRRRLAGGGRGGRPHLVPGAGTGGLGPRPVAGPGLVRPPGPPRRIARDRAHARRVTPERRGGPPGTCPAGLLVSALPQSGVAAQAAGRPTERASSPTARRNSGSRASTTRLNWPNSSKEIRPNTWAQAATRAATAAGGTPGANSAAIRSASRRSSGASAGTASSPRTRRGRCR